MALEITSWLKDLGFTADQIATVSPVLGEKASEIEKAVLRQSDYSREMNRLKDLQTQLDTSNERLNADLAEFATMSSAEQQEASALRDRIEAAEDKAFKLTQKITRYATDNGIDPKTVLGDVEPARDPAKTTATFDPKPLEQTLRTQIGGVASYLLDVNAVMDDIADEHQRLTGERFNRRDFIAGIKKDIAAGKSENLNPVARWEAQFGIPEKRIVATTAARELEIKNAREEGRVAAMSEMALPGGHAPTAGHESPVFKTSNVAKGSVMQRPQPSQRLTGAVSALATGKYRSKPAA